jgi:hypothetical protein
LQQDKQNSSHFTPQKEQNMEAYKYELFHRIALARDFPEKHLRRGDVVTIVDRHPAPGNGEPGYSLEVFNAIGETIDVILVAESDLQELHADEILSVRPLAIAA